MDMNQQQPQQGPPPNQQYQQQPQQPQGANNSHTLIILGYVIPILFFLNLKGQTERFHANQQLILFLAAVIASIAGWILLFIPFLGWLAWMAINLILFILWIIGIMHGANNEMKELPIIGGMKILK
ncbi:MAG: hypothetical protein ABH833_04185 [Parcubacteria group bacterium]